MILWMIRFHKANTIRFFKFNIRNVIEISIKIFNYNFTIISCFSSILIWSHIKIHAFIIVNEILVI